MAENQLSSYSGKCFITFKPCWASFRSHKTAVGNRFARIHKQISTPLVCFGHITRLAESDPANSGVVPLRHLRHVPPQTVWRLWLIVYRTELKVSLCA